MWGKCSISQRTKTCPVSSGGSPIRVAKELQYGGMPSFKQLKELGRIYQRSASPAQSDHHNGNLASYARTEALDIDIKHLCLRMAWHDNRWDGTICKRPAENDFCVGEYSFALRAYSPTA